MAYTCPTCGLTSHHPKDAEEGYCANCDRFEGDAPAPEGSRPVTERHDVLWLDSGLHPKEPSNPAFPTGMDVVLWAREGAQSCKVDLPYPAARIGAYLVNCLLCGLHVRLSTAGRADDPRSLRMPCRVGGRR